MIPIIFLYNYFANDGSVVKGVCAGDADSQRAYLSASGRVEFNAEYFSVARFQGVCRDLLGTITGMLTACVATTFSATPMAAPSVLSTASR